MKRLVPISLLGLVFSWTACVPHQPVKADITEVAMAESFSRGGEIQAPERWWEAFGDEELSELIDRGLQENLSLGQAWARLEQARATYARTRSAESVSLNAGVTGSGAEDLSNNRPTAESGGLSLNLAYEVDLWGKIAADTEAGLLDYRATRKDMEAVALTLSGQIALNWLDLTESNMRLAVLQEQVKVNSDYLKLVELRFSQGLATGTEVYQQRLQLASIRNRIPDAESDIDLAKNRLALLLGENPLAFDLKARVILPDLPGMPETGIPAEVLGARPDVKSAELRLLAADQRLFAARTELYPRLDLTASVGSSGNSFSNILDNWMLNLAGNLLAPILDGGLREAEVDRNRAVVQERFLGWKDTVYTAVAEVEDSLSLERTRLTTLQGTREQVELAADTLESARKNYVNGVTDYLTVLNSLQSLQNLQLEEVAGQRALLVNRLQLYLALGGRWTESLEPGTHFQAGK
ncbi:MAG: TolC family protein [Acidobacteriota bacterium]|nr:TolC family protein [Acidobacteriota bacterium]